jgi:hypothetical protein
MLTGTRAQCEISTQSENQPSKPTMNATNDNDHKGRSIGNDAKENTGGLVVHRRKGTEQDTRQQTSSVATLVSDIPTGSVTNNPTLKKDTTINAEKNLMNLMHREQTEKDQTDPNSNSQSAHVVDEANSGDTIDDGQEEKYLSGWSLVLVTIGFLLGDFVATLDQTMVATALPKLASQFHALDQLTWVVSAFFCEYI